MFVFLRIILKSLCIPTMIAVIECLVSDPCLSPPTEAVKEIIFFLVTLQTLSNQDGELKKEAVLSAREW